MLEPGDYRTRTFTTIFAAAALGGAAAAAKDGEMVLVQMPL
jgi:hypothetical protein